MKERLCKLHVRFLYDEQIFRFIYKFKGDPYRNKWFKPYKEDNTLSLFVTLKDRYKKAYISSLLVYNKSII